ncbi:Uncharacterized membrane protein YfhO [Lachnospiraceae bacterium]|nr:Uncharacterized membrane protein YfhO [Lachnospiraceae bacterium]
MNNCISKAKNILESFRAKKCAYFISYTVLFAVSALLVYGYFVLYGKTMIWEGDGIKQHYNAVLYISRYLKQVVHTLMSEHKLVLPMWDYFTGYGADILTTYHYYGMGDPFMLFSALVPENLMEEFYALLFFERLFIGGLGFSLFSFMHGNKRSSTLIGAMMYCFSAYPMVLATMHSGFLIPVAYFPWILYGAEKIFRKKSPVPFILAIGISGLSNFYFFYMQALLLVLYCVFRYLRIYKGIRIKELVPVLTKFIVMSMIGVLFTLPIIIPAAGVMLSAGRVSTKKAVPILYDFSYYVRFFAYFMNTQRPGSWTLMGYTAVGLFCVIVLFLHKEKEWTGYRIAFIISTLIALIPACGFALTGFSYVVNRWMWAYGAVVGMITAAVISRLHEVTKDEKKRISAVAMILMLISVFFAQLRSEETMFSYACLLSLVMLFMLFSMIFENALQRFTVMTVFFLLGAGANGMYRYSITEGDMTENFIDRNAANRLLTTDNADQLLDEIDDQGVYRIDESALQIVQNSAIERKKRANAYYFSLINGVEVDYTAKLFFNVTEEWNYNGVGSRSALELLTGVKYYLSEEGNEGMIPVQFTEKAAEGDTPVGHVSVWKDPNALPLGYTYDSYVPDDKFSEMSISERTSALLTGAVMDDSSFPEATVQDKSRSILKSIETKGNAQVTDHSFVIGQGGSLVIKLDQVEDSEVHVVFNKLKYRSMKERDSYTEAGWAALTEYEKQNVYRKDTFASEVLDSSIMIDDGTDKNFVGVLTARASTYSGRHNFLCNLGYDEKTPEEITLSFRNMGTYSFDSFDVIAEPMSEVREAEKKLGEEVLTNVIEDTDHISGDITVGTDKILVISMPYKDGWRAWVDGEEVKVHRANVLMMGLELKEGSHHIELRYAQPFAETGIACFAAAVILTMAVSGFYLVRRKKNVETAE